MMFIVIEIGVIGFALLNSFYEKQIIIQILLYVMFTFIVYLLDVFTIRLTIAGRWRGILGYEAITQKNIISH